MGSKNIKNPGPAYGPEGGPGFEPPPEEWSIAKYQIPRTKLQTNLKFQYLMTKTGLEFLFLQYFSTPKQLAIFPGKAIQL
jgi:hypothetical protein